MQISWCGDTGHRLSSVKDLTNAIYNVNLAIVGATPSSPNNSFMRMIGPVFLQSGVLCTFTLELTLMRIGIIGQVMVMHAIANNME